MDPDLLYDVRYDDELDYTYPSQPDQHQMETPPKELISSYSVSASLQQDHTHSKQYSLLNKEFHRVGLRINQGQYKIL